MKLLLNTSNKNVILLCTITFFLVVNSGCAINSDGSITAGFRGSSAWIQNAPRIDVEARYDAMSLLELCNLWRDESRDSHSRLPRKRILEELTNAFERRGLPPSSCHI